jgi:2'-5' RNA ligase
MIVKSYIQFIKESSGYEYGCVMVEVPVSNWDEITSSIDSKDIYTESGDSTYGIQSNPHLTLLYPIIGDVKYEKVRDVLQSILDKEIIIEIDGIDIFENDKFDVVKFNIKSNDYLNKIHDKLKSKIPNDDKFEIYKPHITIGYTKKGTGEKYIKKYNHSVKSNQIVYVNSDGLKEYFSINNFV